MCEALAPVSTGTCEVTAGGGAKLLKGTVLTPTTVYVGGQVAVDPAGHITCVGCNCAQGGETVITCPDASISPGLINTHDHITSTQNDPYAESFRQFRYEHRHQWRRGEPADPGQRPQQRHAHLRRQRTAAGPHDQPDERARQRHHLVGGQPRRDRQRHRQQWQVITLALRHHQTD
jgi:hypothetical protein